jgi:tRNA G26 N,N-dimethylase Trm1
MKAVHILIEGLRDEYEAVLAEMLVRFVDGVKDVASIRSLHLVSVLYDERVASVKEILRTLRAAGFSASTYHVPPTGRRCVA